MHWKCVAHRSTIRFVFLKMIFFPYFILKIVMSRVDFFFFLEVVALENIPLLRGIITELEEKDVFKQLVLILEFSLY